MSKYTTQVRFICETAAGLSESEGQASVKQIIAAAIPSVFDFDFPIFDESYRNVLETKILKHYYTREIGLETVGLWKLKLDTKLNEIMPFYNQLYKSELIEFNPMYDVDLTRDQNLKREETTKQDATEKGTTEKTGNVDDNTHTETSDNQNNESTTDIQNTTGSTSKEQLGASKTHYDKYSDTPQGSLQNVQNDTYLTNARMINDTDSQTGETTVSGNDTSKGTTTANSNTDGTSDTERTISTNDSEEKSVSQNLNKNLNSIDDYIEHVKGKNGGVSFSAMLNEFRTTFLNIDMQIINELSDLFMNLW
nr:MAG TPA: Lower collar protein [Caudoviricetes sp.]